jgi:N-acetyl-alpha-D-muramate 1-phosphate uridylyltransferase
MRPLTDACPKPLLPVHGKPLMQWHLEALGRGGFDRVVVNTAWLGEQIEGYFQSQFPLQAYSILLKQLSNKEQIKSIQITYSHEGRDFGGALETAGGIARALPLLGEVFWVLAGDVFTPDFAFTQTAFDAFAASGKLGHIWLVPNPPHHAKGDFGLSEAGLALNLPAGDTQPKLTFSTIALYRRELFLPPFCNVPLGNPAGEKAPLAPLLRAAMDNLHITAQLYEGAWTDVGTPQRLEELNGTNRVERGLELPRKA